MAATIKMSTHLKTSPITPFHSSRSTQSTRPSRVGLKVFASESKQVDPDLTVKVNGLTMPNPFVIGSGPPGTNYTVMKRAFDEGWGAVIAKTVSFSLIISCFLFYTFALYFLLAMF